MSRISKAARDTVPQLMRRKPTQARGQLRVDEILDAAERLTQTTSWERLTTNHIAREAGVPIGSLYQFFANKQAIAQALVERYVASLEAAFASLPAHIETMTPADLVNLVFDSLLAVTQKHGGFHAMLLTTNDDSEIGRISAPIRELLRGKIESLLAVRAPWMDEKERKLHALVSHVANRAVFAQAISLMTHGDVGAGEKLLQEARIMQIAYYNHLLQEHEAKS